MKTAAVLASGVAVAALVAGCSSSSSSSDSASASASASLVGGTTECSEANLTQAAQQEAEATGNAFAYEALECAEGWAVVSGILGPPNPPSDGPQGAPTTLIFQAEGQFWVPQDKAKVCGTYDAAAPEAVPDDATIPGALYEIGCLTG